MSISDNEDDYMVLSSSEYTNMKSTLNKLNINNKIRQEVIDNIDNNKLLENKLNKVKEDFIQQMIEDKQRKRHSNDIKSYFVVKSKEDIKKEPLTCNNCTNDTYEFRPMSKEWVKDKEHKSKLRHEDNKKKLSNKLLEKIKARREKKSDKNHVSKTNSVSKNIWNLKNEKNEKKLGYVPWEHTYLPIEPRTSFMFYYFEIKKSLEKSTNKKENEFNPEQLTIFINTKWDKLSNESKLKYKQMEDEDNKRYNKEMADYIKYNGNVSVKDLNDANLWFMPKNKKINKSNISIVVKDNIDTTVESNDVVVESNDVVVESNDVVVESNDVVVESNDVVVESNDVVVESNDVVESNYNDNNLYHFGLNVNNWRERVAINMVMKKWPKTLIELDNILDESNNISRQLNNHINNIKHMKESIKRNIDEWSKDLKGIKKKQL